ncbi:hypothetical protein ACPUVO_08930 [Pseudocolwellia sp. HL-MZ19]|uniref:hypothetical protein n=1 Tax=unclassified Pseudocolwellia TaxID=2848178 RepID=UPI003CF9780A
MKQTLFIAITLLTTSFGALADNEMEKEPGLFTGKKGTFTLLKTDNIKTEEQIKDQVKNQDQDVNPSNPKISKKEEFSLFKNWKKHKENNTSQYQEFLLWLEYKEINQ